MEPELELPGTVVFTSDQIARATRRVAAELQAVMGDAEWTLVVVLNGGMTFAGDLMRQLHGQIRVETLRVARYRGETGGKLSWLAQPQEPLAGKKVVLIDDIYDEGVTLSAIEDWLWSEGVAELVSCVLLEKEIGRHHGARPDVVGLTCPDAYVFGYGMDLRDLYRNLDHIRALPAV